MTWRNYIPQTMDLLGVNKDLAQNRREWRSYHTSNSTVMGKRKTWNDKENWCYSYLDGWVGLHLYLDITGLLCIPECVNCLVYIAAWWIHEGIHRGVGGAAQGVLEYSGWEGPPCSMYSSQWVNAVQNLCHAMTIKLEIIVSIWLSLH